MALGIAIGAGQVVACEARRRRGRVDLRAAAAAPLPPGVLVPGFASPNLADPGGCGAALATVLAQMPRGSGLAAAAIPDPTVRVRLLERGPDGGTRAQRAQLVAWQLRESLPFPPAEARVDYVPGAAPGVLAAIASRAVVTQYEDLLRRQGLLPLHVAPASLALWPLLLVSDAAEPLAALFVEPSHATLVAGVGAGVRAWRCLPYRRDDPRAVAREVADSLHALVDDRELAGIPRLVVQSGAEAADGDLLPALREALGARVEPAAWPPGLAADLPLLAAAGAALVLEETLRWR